jgi:hypothetical protein
MLFLMSGCGPSVHPPIEGSIRLDGEPLQEAMISIVPAAGSGPGAVAQSDRQGNFKLFHGGAKPLDAGKYKVFITKMAVPKAGEPPPPPGSSPVPKIYRDVKTTPLELEIPASSAVSFELKSTATP